MKLYRFMKMDLANLECNQKAFNEGRENEARNLVCNNLITPSNCYLNNFDFNDKGPNSFGREQVMTKYFFASLYDVLRYAEHYIKQYYFQYKVKYEAVIMELDFPEEAALPYIGLGNYYQQKVLEYRIPYETLAKNLETTRNPIFWYALEFFNEHMGKYETVWLQICQTEEYQKFISSLPTLNENIVMNGKVNLYPYLAFPASKINILRVGVKPKEYYNWIEECGNFLFDHFYTEHKAHQDKITKYFQDDEINNMGSLMDYATIDVDKENEKLKRVLKHDGYYFQ